MLDEVTPQKPLELKEDEAKQQPQKQEDKLIKEFPTEEKPASKLKLALVVVLILVAGVASGYALSTRQSVAEELKSTESLGQEDLRPGDVFGNPDKETFRDDAEGVLVKGGIDGEGSHHLVRPGGESQNVYLTSSVVDLDQFINHKIRVWGETFAAQKAGWLMDVGRLEVLELNVEVPSEE